MSACASDEGPAGAHQLAASANADSAGPSGHATTHAAAGAAAMSDASDLARDAGEQPSVDATATRPPDAGPEDTGAGESSRVADAAEPFADTQRDAGTDADEPQADAMDAQTGMTEQDVDAAMPSAAQDASPATTDAAVARDAMASSPQVERLIDPKTMPISENGVYTDDGRFFVVGGTVLYEVLAQDGGFRALELLHEGCVMGGAVDRGNVLYIACEYEDPERKPELLRVDPADREAPRVRRADFPDTPTPVLLNGMEFGPDGALYITNSGALLSGAPALYRVKITSEDPLTIDVATFAELDDLDGALAPNGIRFDDNMLYVSLGPSLVRMELRADGTHGPSEEVYMSSSGVVDDFDIANDRLYVACADSADVLAVAALGSNTGSPFGSHVVVATLDGKVERELDLDVIPSSTAVRSETLFGAAPVIVTSYFNGGLYRVTGL